MQLVSQLEILHSMGYVHGELNFHNVCFDEASQRYSIINFSKVIKVLRKNGQHAKKYKGRKFEGNCMLASENRISL